MAELSSLVCEMTQSENVKILVSSRPMEDFEEAFERKPCIVLQDLTAKDIRLMVEEKLASHPGIGQLLEDEQSKAKRLIDEIVRKASGVFLWVSLAVTTMLDGMRNRDGIWELEQRLAEIPPELDKLFTLILRRIPSRYRGQALLILRIMQHWRFHTRHNMTAVTMAFAVDTNQSRSLRLPVGPLAPSQMQRLSRDLDVKLRSRCLGLLEIQATSKNGQHDHEDTCPIAALPIVDFLHKSVAEYLQNTSMLDDIFDLPWTGPDVNVAILNGQIAQMKVEQCGWSSRLASLHVAVLLNRLAEASEGMAQVEAMSQFDAVMSFHFAKERELRPLHVGFEHVTHESDYMEGVEDSLKLCNWRSTFLSSPLGLDVNFM